MRRLAALLAATLSLLAAGPVPERPVLAPTKDVVLGYHLSPGAGEPIDVRVSMRAGGMAMRVDLPDQSYMLAALPARELVLVVPLEQTALDLPWTDGPQALFLPDPAMRFTKKAEATVAGQRCTQWEAALGNARNTLCITAEGVVLRNLSQDPMGRRNLIEAFAIRYIPLPDADFAVPPGFERMLATPKGGSAMIGRVLLLAMFGTGAVAQPAPRPAPARPGAPPSAPQTPQPPRMQPVRDVVVTYNVEGQVLSLIPGGIPSPVRLSWDAAGRRVRAESDARSQVAVLDLNAGTAQAFDTRLRVTMPLPVKPGDLQPLTLDGARLTPKGKDVVAGMPCTTYQIDNGKGPGTVCLSPDGVALRGQGEFDGKPGKFTAVSVNFGRLPPDLFVVPSGYIALGGAGGASGGIAGLLGGLMGGGGGAPGSIPGGLGGAGGSGGGGLGSLSDLKSLGKSLLGHGK